MGFILLPFTALKHLFFQNATTKQSTEGAAVPGIWNSGHLTSTKTVVFPSCSSPIRPSLVFLPWSLAALLQPSFWAFSWSQLSAYKLERRRADDKVTEFRTKPGSNLCPGPLTLPASLHSVRETEVIYGSLFGYMPALCLVHWINLALTTPLWGR